jgi:hypothetical protein
MWPVVSVKFSVKAEDLSGQSSPYPVDAAFSWLQTSVYTRDDIANNR